MGEVRNSRGQFKKRSFSWSDVLRRLYNKISFSSNCWEWQGALRKGYGAFHLQGKSVEAHRLMYELFVGDIPKGFQIDHLCRNPKCVNPYHLEPVTPRENLRRSDFHKFQSTKTHCPRNHEYSKENTYRYGNSRFCKACHNLASAVYRNRIKEINYARG